MSTAKRTTQNREVNIEETEINFQDWQILSEVMRTPSTTCSRPFVSQSVITTFETHKVMLETIPDPKCNHGEPFLTHKTIVAIYLIAHLKCHPKSNEQINKTYPSYLRQPSSLAYKRKARDKKRVGQYGLLTLSQKDLHLIKLISLPTPLPPPPPPTTN